MALALPLPLPLALTASVALHSSKELFTELKELQPISVSFALPLLIPLLLTSSRPRFSSSSYQRTIQTAPKGLLGSPISAQAEPRERPSRLNGTGRTPGTGRTLGSHHTPCTASLLRETIVTMVSA